MVEDIVLVNNVDGARLPLNKDTSEYFILDKVDWGAITASHHEYKYIGQYGVSVVGHTLGTRDIEIKGWIIASTEEDMTIRKAALNKFFNPLSLITLYYSDYSIDFYCQSTIKYGTENSENNEVICHWVVDALAPNPFFKRVKDKRYNASLIVGNFRFPLIMKDNGVDSVIFGKHAKTTLFSVENAGHVPAGFKVEFYARSGYVTNPSIMMVRTREYIKINKVLSGGESVIINTNRGSRSITGVVDGEEINYYMYKDLGSTWLSLDVGTNDISYSADGGLDQLDVTIDFNNMYQEVQECY